MYVTLPTPAVVIELDIAENNIQKLIKEAKAHGIAHRPHVKTHRSSELAKLQLSLGAQGITCAKLGEAEVMAEAGIDDILVCYPLIGEDKMQRLGKLMEKAKVTTIINSVAGARQLSELGERIGKRIPVRIDVDGGLGRGGVKPGQPALEFANQVKDLPGIRIVGLMYYGGLIYHEKSKEDMKKIFEER